MKCEKSQRFILLAASGELSDNKRRVLDAHLAHCPACSDYRADLRMVSAAAREVWQRMTPGPNVMARIRDEAEHKSPNRILYWRPVFVRITSAAATFAILLGAWNFYERSKTGDPIAELHAMVRLIGGDWHSLTITPDGKVVVDPYREIGDLLLHFEGLAMEDWPTVELTDDEINALSEPEPTTLPEHSTVAPADEGRV